tara:strand:- start:1569 stop:2492 length:924 start_codon:yes stop_codon:yes gene_type:complete
MRQLSDKEKFLTITPYFGGISDAPRQTDLELVTKYFIDTYESLKNVSSEFIVSVCNDEDFQVIKNLGFDVEIIKFTNIDPKFLPSNTCRTIQKRVIKQDYVYYTEADQLLYCTDIDYIFNMIINNNTVFVTPQRFCQIPNGVIERRRLRYSDRNEDHHSRYVDFCGINREFNNKYCIECAPFYLSDENSIVENKKKMFSHKGHYDRELYKKFINLYRNSTINGRYYINEINDESYGAAYLCHSELFKRVSYVDSEWQPTEHTAGHDILAHPASISVKSIDNKEFFTDHLSGYDFNKKLFADDWNDTR